MEFILGIILLGAMCYIIYEHFATPFRIISQVKKQKQINKTVEERLKIIVEDEVFKKRFASVQKALDEKKITKEEFEKMFLELVKERKEELFDNSNSDNDI